MRLLVVDTETTGIGPEDQAVEVAFVLIEDGARIETMSTLVRPTVPVAIEARAAHHITDEMLATAPTIKKVAALIPFADVLVAHNAEFDRRILEQSGVRHLPPETICTYRCALHLFPDAPGYSNQVLRYYLNLSVELGGAGAHRALPDTLVTASILECMLERHTVEELVALAKQPAVLKTCRLPKHRDKPWADVPSDYMQWVLKCSSPPFDSDTRFTCLHWLEKRGGNGTTAQ
jgi:exodeoxyribonuclease X